MLLFGCYLWVCCRRSPRILHLNSSAEPQPSSCLSVSSSAGARQGWLAFGVPMMFSPQLVLTWTCPFRRGTKANR
ncbi:hypothetical protein N658DRAFT_357788 [Parathielavia hyrcaniae]|uniref:Uncharacterized protein n=1 Tax=Parathielavia hyrcaniae TaxID=113614 RepID=A0AAN6Q2G6_9PEZI|nr:hypothetical protein N658DRAFT_357788 [Parathielavia hyrcaniae]